MRLKLSLQGDLPLHQQLQALQFGSAKRRRFHRIIGREVVQRSRRRIRAQQDLSGRAWKPRKHGRRKMMRRILRGRNVKIYAGARRVTVTWPNHLVGQVARRQQEGITETVTARQLARQERADSDDNATVAQARALKREGFRVYVGKSRSGRVRTRHVSQRWIRDNMRMRQAGLILRLIRENSPQTTWQIPLPARSFLGLSEAEIAGVSREIISRLTNDAVKQTRTRG